MNTTTSSKLEKILAAGHPAVTSECGPPRNGNGRIIEEKVDLIKDYVLMGHVLDFFFTVT